MLGKEGMKVTCHKKASAERVSKALDELSRLVTYNQENQEIPVLIQSKKQKWM